MLRFHTTILTTALAVLTPAVAHAQDTGYQIVALDEMEFVPFGEGPVTMHVLWGDPAIGPVGFLLRVPPGFDAGVHAHTADYRALVVQGEALHWIDTEDRAAVARVGPGGYWFQPGGQFHGDANETDGEVIALVIFDGPVDFLMAE